MDIGDLATWVGSIATTLAVLFAGRQLTLLLREQRLQREMEVAGVVVSWVQIERPRKPEADGWATWVFEITVENPGRMPIRNVEVDLDFPAEVRRRHYDGHLDEPTRRLSLGLPVLAGGSSKPWTRSLRMKYDDEQSLRTITATVTFFGMDGERHENTWGAGVAPSLGLGR